jgi:hypothetical protein
MSRKSNSRKSKIVDQESIEGSDLEGIVEIDDSELLDEVVGGTPYGAPNYPSYPPPYYPPPTTYPGQPPASNCPPWGGYQ